MDLDNKLVTYEFTQRVKEEKLKELFVSPAR